MPIVFPSEEALHRRGLLAREGRAARWPAAGKVRRGSQGQGSPSAPGPSAPEPAELPPRPSAPRKAILSCARWLCDQGRFGGHAPASVDVRLTTEADPPVSFFVREILPDGTAGPAIRGGEGRIRAGTARAEVAIPQPALRDGALPETARFQLLVRHALAAELQGPLLPAGPETDTARHAGVLYYAPGRDEYLHLESAEAFSAFRRDLRDLEGLRERAALAWETPDPGLRAVRLEDVDGLADRIFGDGASAPAGGSLAELILVRKHPAWGRALAWIYYAPGRWRKPSDPLLRKNLADLFAKAPGNGEVSPLLSGELGLKLLAEKPGPRGALLWKRVDKEGRLAGQAFTFAKERAVGRFLMGFDGARGSLPLFKRKLIVGASGHLQAEILQGSMEGRIPCPEHGVNVVELIRAKGVRDFLREGRQCLMRLEFKLGAEAFAGLSLRGALTLPHLDLSRERPRPSLEARAEGLLGVRAQESLEVAPQWSPTAAPAHFQDLGRSRVEFGVDVGLAAGARFEIGYAEGKFVFRFGGGVAFGVGPRGGVQFEARLDEGWRLIGHLLGCVDYHYVADVRRQAFDAFSGFAWFLLAAGREALHRAEGAVSGFLSDTEGWLRALPSGRLASIKSNLRGNSVHVASLGLMPPETLGRAVALLATEPGPGDGDAVLRILHAALRRGADFRRDASANHKLKWILRHAGDRGMPERDSGAYAAAKETALRDGIRRLRESGMRDGGGDESGNGPGGGGGFAAGLEKLLRENGLA